MALKVIGAGFGRTGTMSLRGALEELGYNKCYHMREVIANPKHAELWWAAAEGKATDWDALLEGYQATVDWPGCTFYKALTARYPDAKMPFNDRFADKAYALKVFNDHIEEVKATVPAEKLLVYEVREGWEPLCAFLEVPVPDKPFPRLNDSATFNRRLGQGIFRPKKSSHN